MPLAAGFGDGRGVPNKPKPTEPFPVQPGTRTRNNFASRWVAARRDEKCPLENGGLWPKPLFPSDSDFVLEQPDDLQQTQRAANLTITGFGLTII
jgi:hypothetical protein